LTPPSPPAHRLSPSAFGRSFEFECDRQLKVTLLADEHTPEPWRALKLQGREEMKTRAGTRAVLDAGRAWEEEALSRPAVRARLVAPPAPHPDAPVEGRRWAEDPAEEARESLRVLRAARPGELLYQLKLTPPAALYARLGLSAAQVELRPNLPDLVQVLTEEEVARERLGALSFAEWLARPSAGEGGGRVFRVIDLKRSAQVKVSHRAQVLFYALELDEVLRAEGVAGRVDLDLGGVWLGGREGPDAVRLDAVRPFFEARAAALPALLAAPVAQARWRLQPQCEWCDLRPECAAQAAREDHISRLQGVTARGLETLEALGARTTADLDVVLRRPQIDDALARCASLDQQALTLQARVRAHVTRAPAPLARLSQLLPAREDVALFLTAHSEPGLQRPWGLGLLAVDRAGATGLPADPFVLVAASADEVLPNLLNWFCALERALGVAARAGAGRALTVQLYCYSHLERRLALDALRALRAEAERRRDEGVWGRCERVLHVIQGAELISGARHPAALTEAPVVPLLSALSGLYALPIDVSYTLPEVAAALALGAPYPRSEARHFPYGHQLRSDEVLDAWGGARVDLEPTREDLRARLRAYAALLDHLRAQRPEAAVRALPPFRLPEPSRLRHHDLSRLAYIARYERSVEEQGTRALRFEGMGATERYSRLPVLQSFGGGRFGVVALPLTLRVEAGGFAPWLLVEASDDGLARAARARESLGGPLPDRVAYVRVGDVTPDPRNPPGAAGPQVGDGVTFWGGDWRDGEAPAALDVPAGRYLFLCPCHADSNTDKSLKALERIDGALPPRGAAPAALARGATLLVSLLEGQAAAHNALEFAPPVARRLEEARLAARLTPSQRDAWARVARQRVSAVWGPPGTGKTHFLASYILAAAAAHAAEGRDLRVAVSAMTNAAIDNLMAKLAELSAALPAPLPLIRVGSWTVGPRPPAVEVIEDRRRFREIPKTGAQVIGATQWKLDALKEPIDLLVIDEASQLLISHACVGLSLLKEGGRLVVAGDHEQLGPVLKGDYPREDPAEARLVSSILDLVRGATLDPRDPHRAGVPMCQLLENFRMCEALTAASRAVYGPRYVCATPEVAARRLSRDVGGVRLPQTALDAVYDAVRLPDEARAAHTFVDPGPFVRECLRPSAALTLVSLEGTHAARENPREAALVALLALALREAAGPGRADEDFWREDLFVIGPHHRQNDLTRGALKAARRWARSPFVETVDKAQGQEAECVLVTYGVSDEELAAAEGSFLYERSRLNVSLTRAKAKAVLFLSRPLLDGSALLLDDPRVASGLGYMQGLERLCAEGGRAARFDVGGGGAVVVRSLG